MATRDHAPLDEDGMTEEGPFPAPCPTCGRRWFHIEGCSDGH